MRYVVMGANGATCCNSDDINNLCASCRARVQAGLVNNQSNQMEVPPPPDLNARILAARGIKPTPRPEPRAATQATGVTVAGREDPAPPPPDMNARIIRARAGGAR